MDRCAHLKQDRGRSSVPDHRGALHPYSVAMDIVEAAYAVAEDHLSGVLPRRWQHVQAVANKAQRVAVVLLEPERQVLVAAAWLHDIGYAPEIASTGLHALDGARWLHERGWDERVVRLVGNHSCAAYEADERGLANELRAEFPGEDSPLTDALWYADMTTGPDGQDFEIHERLAEIRDRYGSDHPVTRFWRRAEPAIVAAVRRTEQRMQGPETHPM
jgi:putative nucleotidyltransferase with HDIG domain